MGFFFFKEKLARSVRAGKEPAPKAVGKVLFIKKEKKKIKFTFSLHGCEN